MSRLHVSEVTADFFISTISMRGCTNVIWAKKRDVHVYLVECKGLELLLLKGGLTHHAADGAA